MLHMTSDEKTAEQMDSDPGANTVFHSDLPYCFIREQFTLTSYTTWAGGHKFALGSTLKTFRAANPDLAFLMMLEDGSGNTWLHEPLIDVRGVWHYYYNDDAWRQHEIVACLNGATYQAAFTDGDADLANLTQNDFYPTIAWTFKAWETSNNYVTIFKTPFRHCRTPHNFFPHIDYFDSTDCFWYMGSESSYGGTNLQSTDNDVTKVKFIFLNVEHTTTTFDRMPGFAHDDITIDPDSFIVNDIDLAEMTPLVSRGFRTVNTTITPYTSGDLIAGKTPGLNMTIGKINSSNKLIDGNAAVLEVPPDPGSFTGWDINFNNQVIKRSGVEVFNSTWADRALFVAGTREISFSTSVTLTNATVDTQISSTQSGDIGSCNSNTVYLASVIWAGQKIHSTSVMSASDNLVSFFTLGQRNNYDGVWKWGSNVWYYLRITYAGVVTVRRKYEPGDPGIPNAAWSSSISSVGLSLPSMKIRLISLRAL